MTAVEVVTGRVTNPGAAFTALTPNTGNTFAIRSHSSEGTAYLEEIWTQQATAGQVRVKSPRMHDDVVGIRMVAPAASVRRLLPEECKAVVYPQDELTVEMTGGGAEVDSAALLLYYADLGGINARLAMWEEIVGRIEYIHSFPVAVAGPATSGDWSAGTRIDTTVDELKANRDYAVLGYTLDAECLAVALAGTDTGNLKVGGPGSVQPDETRAFYVDQSRRMGTPHIPIINSANRQGTLAHVARITAAGTVNVTFTTALLR